jgi:hypothetical protein
MAAAGAGLLANTDVGTNAPGDGIPDGLCDVWQNHFDAIAGTDPSNPNDGLKIANVANVGDSIAFSFVAEKGKKYRVAGAENPGGPEWIAIPGSTFVSANDHENQTISIPRPTGPASEFYRIEVQENDADADGVSD